MARLRLRPVGDWIDGRFEVFAVHRGGMGVVYVAHDHLAEGGRHLLAIKTLQDDWLADPDWAARFAAEGELWVRLGSHPNIVHAHAVAHYDGRPHILLELVTGGDLRRCVGTSALDVPRILDLGIQFCSGMDHAVRQGLRCHRDVKPGNLLLTPDGTLKITDFGLAVIRDELAADADFTLGLDLDDEPTAHASRPEPTHPVAPASPPPAPTALIEVDDEPDPIASGAATRTHRAEALSRLTQTGSILGTIPYMAPEQFRDSKAVDIRADIYAFGVVLFELLTGAKPFHGTTIARLDRAHERYQPPSVAPSIPRRYSREAEAIDDTVQRCLRKDPADRFATMTDLRRALLAIHRRVDPHAPRRPTGKP